MPSNELRALRRELATVRGVLADVASRLHAVPATEPSRPLPGSPSQLPAFTPYVGHIGRRWPLQQLRRSRGWSQPALIARMRAVAAAEGLRLPETSSLKTMVSRWENRGVGVSSFYDTILCTVFELADPTTETSQAPIKSVTA